MYSNVFIFIFSSHTYTITYICGRGPNSEETQASSDLPGKDQHLSQVNGHLLRPGEKRTNDDFDPEKDGIDAGKTITIYYQSRDFQIQYSIIINIYIYTYGYTLITYMGMGIKQCHKPPPKSQFLKVVWLPFPSGCFIMVFSHITMVYMQQKKANQSPTIFLYFIFTGMTNRWGKHRSFMF
jgi:hypothetical protein